MKKKNYKGYELSEICLGSADFGYGIKEDAAFEILDCFCDFGGNFIDTANVYCRWIDNKNGSEELLGNYMRKRKKKLIIATKGGHYDFSEPEKSRIRLKSLMKDAEESLKSLSLDVLPFYWLHRDDPNLPAEDIIGFCEQLKDKGLIEHYGGSNISLERLQSFIEAAEKNKVEGFFGLSNSFSLAKEECGAADATMKRVDDEMFDFLCKNKFPLFPYSAAARGFFERRKKLNRPVLPEEDPVYGGEENERRYAILKEISERNNLPVTATAVALLSKVPFPLFPIISSSKVHLEQVNRATEALGDVRIFDKIWTE